MLIFGAGGHAKEILDILEKNNYQGEIFFFDDITKTIPSKLYNKYLIINSLEKLLEMNLADKKLVLGIGNPHLRYLISKKFKELDFELYSIVSNFALISNYNVILGSGLNIMHNVFISNDVEIGEGTLINNRCNIHHNVKIGKFCEISPNVCITGNVLVGEFTSIGASAVIIPKIKIGKNCIIGAGSVVNRDIPDNSVAVGSPASVIKEVELFNE